MSRANRFLQTAAEQWEKNPSRLWWVSSVAMLGLAGLSLFWHLGSVGVFDETEPLFAEASRQMTLTGDWVTPYFNQTPRYDKPPLIYWFQAIAYGLLGVNEWAVRLPSALAALGLALFCFVSLRTFGIPNPDNGDLPTLSHRQWLVSTPRVERQRWWSAWIGTAAFLLAPEVIAWARMGVSDMLLTGCIGGALLCFFWGYVQPLGPVKARWYLGFYSLMALAVLTKGPIGLVLSGLIVGLFLLAVGQWRQVWQEIQPLRGLSLLLLVTVPWYILVTLANGEDYIDSFFGYHNLERFTRVVNNHAAPWYFYFVVVLLGFMPWSIHLPVAMVSTLHGKTPRLQFWRRWRQQPRVAHLGVFALVWFAVVFGFFTVAVTKLPSYVLPLMPAAAILIGLYWSAQITRPASEKNRADRISSVLTGLFLLVLAAVVLYSPSWLGTDPAMPNLPEAVQQSGIVPIAAGIWLVTGLSQLVLVWRQERWVWLANLVGMVLFLSAVVIPAAFLIDTVRQLPLRQIAATIQTERQPDEAVIMVGDRKPSLVFYSHQNVEFIQSSKDVAGYLKDRTANENLRPRALVVGYPRQIQQMELQPSQFTSLQRAGGYELIRVQLRRRTKAQTFAKSDFYDSKLKAQNSKLKNGIRKPQA